MTMANAPIGFEPRPPAVRSLWLHTIELDPDQCLVGGVIVVGRHFFPDLPALLIFITGDARTDLIVHETETEVWLRLDRGQLIDLRHKLGLLNGSTSPFGDDSYDSYGALVQIENIVDGEDN